MIVRDPITPPRLPLLSSFKAAFFLLCASASLLFGQADAARNFSIAAADAETSFRQFSEQAGVQFIYSAEKIRDVRTNAVSGKYTSRQAIDRMLEGTPLVAVYDSQSGALTVDRVRSEPPATEDAQKKSRVEDAAAAPQGDVIVLSPFEVTETQGSSYQAESTLAGNRLSTRLRDVGSAISVVTAQMLRDISATSNESLLQYMPSAEVGNIYGNMANVGSGQVLDEKSNLLTPNSNTRIRGLASADNTIDFFLTDIPWQLQRQPHRHAARAECDSLRPGQPGRYHQRGYKHREFHR
jgi:hypothetical protein